MRKGLWFWPASALVAGGLVFTVTHAEDVFPTAATGSDRPALKLPDAFRPAGEEEVSPRPYVRTPVKVEAITPEQSEPVVEVKKGLPVPERFASKPPVGTDSERASKIVPADHQAAPTAKPEIEPVARKVRQPQVKRTAEPVREAPPVKATTEAPVTSRTAAIVNTEPACVTVKWLPSGELAVGQETVYHLVVKNEGKGAARDVEVEAHFPRTCRLLKAEPAPASARECLAWTLPQLAASEEQTLAITLMPLARGDLATNAVVRFATSNAITAQVSEPQLAVALKGVSAALVGEPTLQIITVTNSGTGTAREVVVKTTLPEGLESAHGKGKELLTSIGSLAAGESRDVRLQVTAVASGDHVVAVSATGLGGLEHEAQTKVTVTAPRLEVAVTGPSLRFAERHARYQLIAANQGAAATNNVRLTHHVPAGFEFVRADSGGSYDPASRTVSWFVGHMPAGKAVQVSTELKACELGDHTHRVQVTGDSVPAAESKIETKVDGASDLVMDVTDLDDPVEVGTQTAYEIRVKNEGTKAATAVTIACELPAGATLLGAEGPVKHTAEAGRVTFAPIAELGPHKSLKFTVLLEGKTAGAMRFRAELTSSSITEPVVVEERTRFYGE